MAIDSVARVDLDTCAREPIRIPGGIQPYAALIVTEDEALNRLPVLDVTGYADSKSRRNVHGTPIIHKPYREDELRQKREAALPQPPLWNDRGIAHCRKKALPSDPRPRLLHRRFGCASLG